jgi:hypothetical protein
MDNLAKQTAENWHYNKIIAFGQKSKPSLQKK